MTDEKRSARLSAPLNARMRMRPCECAEAFARSSTGEDAAMDALADVADGLGFRRRSRIRFCAHRRGWTADPWTAAGCARHAGTGAGSSGGR